MQTIDLILSRLEKVYAAGNDKWRACCPSHVDGGASLEVVDFDGIVVFNCRAGCSSTAVFFTLGLSWSDVFPKLKRSRA